MAPKIEGASRRVRVTAFLLIAGLVAGPVGTHVYWMLGGTWGLQRSVDGRMEESTTMGIRVVAAVVVLLLLAAVLVVLARVGLWQQTLVSDRVIRLLAWALAVFFLGHALVSFAEGFAGMQVEWWLYGPAGIVIGLLALVVAGSGEAWPRLHGPHRTPTDA
jgi:Protein of unknown function (DUF3995)